MADCDPPSFSLGLDLGFDSEPQSAFDGPWITQPVPDPPVNPSAPTPQDNGDEFEPDVADSDPESRPQPPRLLKRLRRGPPTLRETPPLFSNGDDEIEEFSSQEDVFEELPSTQYHSMGSSSKIPLYGCGAITRSSSVWKARKTTPVSTATASASTKTSHGEILFPKLTVSPLRRFQLIDSDSDGPCTSEEGIIRGNHKVNQSFKKQQSNAGHSATTSEKTRKASDCMPQGEDLWKDFCPIKSVHIPTPVLDEVCEEYFRSVKEKNASEKLGSGLCVKSSSGFRDTTNPRSSSNLLLPSHRYFLHHDPRIRKLVRNRLPNFLPLGIDESSGNHQNGGSVIDYMGQFGNREPAKRRAAQEVDLQSSKRGRNKAKAEEVLFGSGSSMNPQQGKATKGSAKKSSKKQSNSVKRSSKKGRNTTETSSAGEGLHDPGGWVDTRSNASVKKGVQSNSQSGGHWYTGPGGRKVYVSKNGQELTGQIAYRQYKKDRGTGLNKGKRKASSKKKRS